VTAPQNLVGEEFWEDDYLGGVTLPSRPDPGFPFERALAAALERHAPVAPGAIVLEAGCAPAKWLVFYAERFGARVTGIEYTPRGAELSRRNLAAAGRDGEIIEGDFFAVEPRPSDLVLSLGFIEHFDDLDAAFARHVAFLAPGGRLAIGVPNYTGLLGAIQHAADPEHLALHNRAAMDPELYRAQAARHGLRVERQVYLGGPDPDLLRVRHRAWQVPVLGLRVLRPLGARLNRPWLSAYLLTVLRRA
jgi:SAM-dependent methyltransferase